MNDNAFSISEAQLQELAGRLEQITRSGVSLVACQHASAILTLLQQVAAPPAAASNVVEMKEAG